jgi:hypothetical protein
VTMFYRVMVKDEDGFPRCGDIAHHLGARPGMDISAVRAGNVLPRNGGLSVTLTQRRFRRTFARVGFKAAAESFPCSSLQAASR